MFIPEDPTDLEVEMAKSILSQQAKKRAKIVALFIEHVQLLANSEREGTLEIRFDTDSFQVNLWQQPGFSFTLYSFEKMDSIRAGFKLIRGYIEKGENIPWHSMSDKRFSEEKAEP